jgi:hypothetical protein
MDDIDDGLLVLVCECGEEIGREVRYRGKVMLKVGATVAYSHHGYCLKCERQVHYDSQDAIMRRILKRSKKNGLFDGGC